MKTEKELEALAKTTVHNNGTNGNDLFNEYRTAMTAVGDAIDAVANITVHGRDYYVQEGDALHQALEERDARIQALRDIRDELEHIAVYLMDYADGGQYGRKL